MLKKLSLAGYTVAVDPAATRAYYAAQPNSLVRCSCPGCQNFFKSIGPYKGELAAALGILGIDGAKPDSVEVLYAAKNRVVYEAVYKFVGKKLKGPKLYKVHKNELGSIYVFNPEARYRLNENMSFALRRAGERETEAVLTAELPWVMETLGCIYDEAEKIEKPKKSRLTRIIEAAAEIIK